MLVNRKTSFKDGMLMADYGPDENLNDNADIEWVNKSWVRLVLRLCAFVSMISVSANTPETFKEYPMLMTITLILDLVIMMLFTAELVAKMRIRGVFKGEAPYMKDRWCRFDGIMVICLWGSVILQIYEIAAHPGPESLANNFRIIRAPRPLILVRVFRNFLKFQLPKNRINSIFKRSSQQIYNVTIFFLFFMSLYGFLGVQFFGKMKHKCVRNGTDPSNVTLFDLAVPDTFCSPDPDAGYQCQNDMVCMELAMSPAVMGFNGFDHLPLSVFTVYQAASQEGWVFLMYNSIDSLQSYKAYLYFLSLIFFLAWLVKNVFIAVIIETFAEIRVQFQQMWGSRGGTAESDASQVIQNDGGSWKLVMVDENKTHGLAPPIFQQVLRSNFFHTFILLLVLIDAVIAASLSFDHHKKNPNEKFDIFYYSEVVLTILFALEAVFKIWCLGLHGYLKRSLHKFELVLVFGTTLHIIPELYRSLMTSFQVVRLFRLIKASPILEGFCFKIFGPPKKLGSLILFTMCLLIIASSISLQLFCFIPGFKKFQTFKEAFLSMFQIMCSEGWTDVSLDLMNSLTDCLTQALVAIYFMVFHLFVNVAFMSMFQILTQKGWIEVMHVTMYNTGEKVAPFVAIYFIFYHLFVTLIVISLFVAVILDNLELDEDIKKLKQLKLREQSLETQEMLPLRLRIFSKFPDHPQMVRLYKMPGEFQISDIRESFIRQFTSPEGSLSLVVDSQDQPENILPELKSSHIKLIKSPMLETRSGGTVEKKSAIVGIIRDANQQKIISGGSAQLVPVGGRTMSILAHQHQIRMERSRSTRGGSRPTSLKLKAHPAMKENGDINPHATLMGVRRMDDLDIKDIQQKKQQAEQKRNQQEVDLRENHPYFDTPLFLIGRESKVRKICEMIVNAKYDYVLRDPDTGKKIKSNYKQLHKLLGLVTYLDWVMIIVTILSCISMCFETPKKRIMENPELQVAEYVFVVFMSVEMGLKIISNGLLFTPNAVVNDFRGILDLFIYGVSIVFVFWMPKNIEPHSKEHILMLLRCCRPLRIYSLVPHMRRVVYELVRGFKEIVLVSVLLIVLMFVFAICGVHILGGRLAKCNDPNITTKEDCHGIYLVEVLVTKMALSPEPGNVPAMYVPRAWINPRNFNFDNIGNAMLALFEVLSLEGWLEVRDVISSRVGIAEAIYIHFFVFIGYMIGLTLFVGVVIANYGENKGTALLTVDQRRWLDLKGRIKLAQPLHIPPRPERNMFRTLVYDITQHLYFKRFIVFLVIANCLMLSVPWKDDANKSTMYILAGFSTAFTLLFFLEVIMKMIALSPAGYWTSRRNRFDMFVTLLGVIWIILHYSSSQSEHINSLGYIVIVLRFFTVTGKHATLKMLMQTVVMSLFKALFIIMGMFLLMLFYAYAGVILFGSVKYGYNLGRQANFETAFNAILLLFRIVTGEDWNKIMHDCMVSTPFCSKGGNFWQTDCGNYFASIVYFCSFYVIITYIVLNLLVAIIMENFSLFYSNEEDALLSYNDIRQFQNTWNLVDINRKGMIPARRVRFLLRLLRGRLEVDLERDRLLFKHMCYEIEKLHQGGEVTFHDVLSMLSYRSVDIRKSLQLEESLAREELEFTIEEEVAKQTIKNWLDKCLKRIRAREHSNIISNLRATNEPMFTVTELSLMNPDNKEENKEDGQAPPRTRKKGHVELRTPVIQPPSLSQAGSSRKFLTPPLNEGGTRSEKDRTSLRRRSCKASNSSNKQLPLVNENNSDSGTTTFIPNLTTDSSLVGKNVSSDISSWWKEQSTYTNLEEGVILENI
ncbi:sodium leak channel NALCN-like isoform X2 [Biomphalaria glabrata]|uniref:Sodium leak channel NALCN-like isoform X2 n=1 Tax=Biomphalaria glabrata TaxID=6526 RepID=A0A9W2Z2G7_BIOGL|nr:sodium leak channel NALCN-like isoform X2 [Biomphalaria glabrata]